MQHHKFYTLLFLFMPAVLHGAPESFLGREVCAGCHKDIAATHVRTRMAQTWQGAETKLLPPAFVEKKSEGPEPDLFYLIQRKAGLFNFSLQMPGSADVTAPVESTIGGSRHGLSFMTRVAELDGVPLARAPLIEARYMHYLPHSGLERSPGFPEEKPHSLETAFGRVLLPQFEKKCLSCHGQPASHPGHADAGVTCENCHGSGQGHLVALGRKATDKAILNPAHLPANQQMNTCAQCHSGFSLIEDPMPDDLLISDQVTSLSNSECRRQSGGEITCTNCHNPHQDAPRATLVARTEQTCLGCHSATKAERPALCPVNRVSGCVGCHMPDERKAPLVVADHWIRVHPEQKVRVPVRQAAWRSQREPKHEYLRLLTVDDPGKAEALHAQLKQGASFFDLARANSTEKVSAQSGGYLGDLAADQFDHTWAAAALQLRPGELSSAMDAGGKYVLLQRLDRNFREQAEQVFNHGLKLRDAGKKTEAAAQFLEALKIYPHLLRALTYLGISYAEAGNAQTGAAILQIATNLYPNDAGAHFNRGLALGAMGQTEEISEYEQAIKIDPDLVLAYLNLGAAYYTKGETAEAIAMYRRGIAVNPLVASLHYSLSVALERDGKTLEAETERQLAKKIDPQVGS